MLSKYLLVLFTLFGYALALPVSTGNGVAKRLSKEELITEGSTSVVILRSEDEVKDILFKEAKTDVVVAAKRLNAEELVAEGSVGVVAAN